MLERDDRGYVRERVLRDAVFSLASSLHADWRSPTPPLWLHRVFCPLEGGRYTVYFQHDSEQLDDDAARARATRAIEPWASDFDADLYLYADDLKVDERSLVERDRAFAFLAAYAARRTPDRFAQGEEFLWLHEVRVDAGRLRVLFCVESSGDELFGSEFAERAREKLLDSKWAPSLPVDVSCDRYR